MLVDVSERHGGRYPFDPAPRVWQCSECGALVRPGQPHLALSPRPHETVGALITVEHPSVTAARDGSHGELLS